MSTRSPLPVLLVLALTACDDLGLNAEPEQLSVRVEAMGVNQVAMITSTEWVYTQDPACDPNDPGGCPDVLRILDADTTMIPATYERTLRFTNDYRYLIEVFPAGGQTATIRMQIDIDGRRWFDEARELRPVGANGGQETLQFVYQWRRPTLP